MAVKQSKDFMTDISLRWREIRGVHKGYLNLEFRQLAFLTALNHPYAKSFPATQSNFLRITAVDISGSLATTPFIA
jgi:hypothetical protein